MAGEGFRGRGCEEKVPGQLGKKTNSISELSTWSYTTAGAVLACSFMGCTNAMGPHILDRGTSIRGDSGP